MPTRAISSRTREKSWVTRGSMISASKRRGSSCASVSPNRWTENKLVIEHPFRERRSVLLLELLAPLRRHPQPDAQVVR